MADQRISYNEYMVGAGHPTKADTLNRHANIEHNTDGTHKMTDGAAGVLYYHDGTRLVALPAGATTKILVGGGAGAPVWTEATGSGAPVRATSPALVTPALGTPVSGDLRNCSVATEANKGVTVYAGSVKALAGTDTASAMTPADVRNKVAVDVNPKAMSQGVAMTAAASGSNGIAVVDNDNIDYGTGNFFGVISVLLADYTPSAEVVLEQKTDGTNGRKFTLQTNGKLRVTINTTDYDSTVATGCTDNTNHVFGYSVTRETAAAAGSIIFVVDGIQLGDAVAITAGAPTTINNAVPQYVLGTSATRTAGTVNRHVSGNRTLTAAEHLALYRNGIAEADKWGSQTNLNVSNCENGVGGLAFDTFDGISATGFHAILLSNKTTKCGTADEIYWGCGKRFRIEFDCVISGSVDIFYYASIGIGSTIITPFTAYTCKAVSGHNTYEVVITYPSYLGVLEFYTANVVEFTVSNLSIKRIGATLALEPEGIQPAPGQWLDSSSNKLHALQPAVESSLTRSKRDFTIKWTNTWAGTHELQYIGGVNQAILPPNCYIDSIIGVITGGTIEDIIVGDGSDTDRWVTITTGLAAGTVAFTIANAISDGTNYKMTVDPDANFTGSISWTITGKIL